MGKRQAREGHKAYRGHKGHKGRVIALSILAVIVVTVIIHGISAATLDRWVDYKEITFTSPNVTAELNGYRIAYITDTHETSEDALREIAQELNTKDIDLLLLGGDYSSNGRGAPQVMRALSSVDTSDGIYGVQGNHDNREILYDAMQQNGITALANNGLSVRDNLYIGGTEDLWKGKPNIAEALSGAAPDDFVLLLAHNPDTTMVQPTAGADLILSGHTHGGQVTLFGLFAPALATDRISEYGHRFKSGWASSNDGTPVYVSNGIGTTTRLPRVFAQPQVIIITLSAEER